MQSHLPKVLSVCNRRAAAVGPRPGAYLSGVAVQPASSFCCSVQSKPTRDRLMKDFLFRPEQIEAIMQGRQPVALTATRLTELDLPLDWTEQHKLLAI